MFCFDCGDNIASKVLSECSWFFKFNELTTHYREAF